MVDWARNMASTMYLARGMSRPGGVFDLACNEAFGKPFEKLQMFNLQRNYFSSNGVCI